MNQHNRQKFEVTYEHIKGIYILNLYIRKDKSKSSCLNTRKRKGKLYSYLRHLRVIIRVLAFSLAANTLNHIFVMLANVNVPRLK